MPRARKRITPPAKKKPTKTPTKKPKRTAKDSRLRLIFNTTEAESKRVLAYQNHLCPVTLKPMSTPYLDHRHKDGLLRGFLSFKANKGLALFDDDSAQLRRAADYIDDPPYVAATGEHIYGVIGKVTKKITRAQRKKGITRVQRLYGPHGTPEPQEREELKR